jgi:hypothetical protein
VQFVSASDLILNKIWLGFGRFHSGYAGERNSRSLLPNGVRRKRTAARWAGAGPRARRRKRGKWWAGWAVVLGCVHRKEKRKRKAVRLRIWPEEEFEF